MPVSSAGWQVLGASVVGTTHQERDVPCEDAHATRVTATGLMVVAVADGAGSAPRAARGAKIAVEAAVTAIEDDDVGDLDAVASAAVHAARFAVETEAGEEDVSELACTLIVVVTDGKALAHAQVGDGGVVIRRNNAYEALAAPERGEYLNETCFITSASWEEQLCVGSTDACGIDAFGVFTDGVQLLALDLVNGEPHPGFFAPLFDWASKPHADTADLDAFLASERVGARTDDDKTLVLVTRVVDQLG